MVNKNLALYSHIRSVQDINDAHQKLNGVLQRKLSEANNKRLTKKIWNKKKYMRNKN